MAELDAGAVGQLAARLGLVTADEMQESLDELGEGHSDADEYLRVLERKGYLTPWQSQKLLKGEFDGYFLGGYRLLYKISSGSFGRVYRADEPRTGMIVAIKVLRNRWTEDKKKWELFEREGKVGMTMKHPNIVEILAVNCDPKSKQFYIVMEFVEGGNLRDFLKIRKKLEPAETLRILEDAAAGLAYASKQGISHRDMKLTNVLISSAGQAKLVDFGLANLNQQLHKKDDVQVDRTVDYAGLEKATNAPLGDVRSDIYFLGCVGYELLTGRSPLEKSKSAQDRMRSARFQNVPPMTPEEVNAPPSVFRLFDTMMALDPSLRYQTPSQLLDAIRAVRRDLDGVANKDKGTGNKSLFIVEKDQRLQDALRDKFKEAGYRVLLSGDPVRALDRFRQQPFDSLIMDVGTVDEEGLYMFDRIMDEVKTQERRCAGIMILSEHQEDWKSRVKQRSNTVVLVRPVTVKQLKRQLEELFAKED